MAGYAHTIADTLQHFSKEYGLSTFVETGTFKGVTTEIASGIFERVFTIELREDLYEAAKKRFENNSAVVCMQGDSAEVLQSLLAEIPEDALFFLDAHWAGELSARGDVDSPLLQELRCLADRSSSHHDLIIIDDVSFFDQKGSFEFAPGSAYFPDGGLFTWDWTGIRRDRVLELFPGKRYIERDDRLYIGIREPAD